MRATLTPEEIVLMEGAKRVLSVELNEDDGPARVRHPLSGLKIYEFIDVGPRVDIHSAGDVLDKCSVTHEQVPCSSLLLMTGCLFTKEEYVIRKEEDPLARVTPIASYFQENHFRATWLASTEADIRLMTVIWAILATIREGFPHLHTILKEYHSRHI
ncbi:unnamed protein product, partial [Mesorhabditis spiculigera]